MTPLLKQAPPEVAGAPSRRLVRSFATLSAEERLAFQRLQAEFWRTSDLGRRLAILEEIAGSFYSAESVALAQNILGLHEEALSLAAIGLLAGNTSVAILPPLETALADPSPVVRREAVLAVSQVRDDAVIGFFGKAFEDREPDVRLNVFNALDDQSRERRIGVFSRALAATHGDVQTAAVDSLQSESSPKSVEALIPALDSPHPELREAARFSLEFQLSQTFPNASAARVWWAEHRGDFDQDLAPK